MEEAAAAEEVCASDLLENLSREGCERQREHYKTIDLITEYNDFHVGMQLAGHLSFIFFRKQSTKSSLLWFSREHEQQSISQY